MPLWSGKYSIILPSASNTVADLLGAPQYYGSLNVTLRAFDKKKQNTDGTEEVIVASSDEEDADDEML